MDKFTLPLLEGNYYHLFNRANSSRKLFYKKENYEFFLRKFDEHIFEFIKLFAFCLLPNHFHLLIKVDKEHQDLPVIEKPYGRIRVLEVFHKHFRIFLIVILKLSTGKKLDTAIYFNGLLKELVLIRKNIC